jgi:hypothetical protein
MLKALESTRWRIFAAGPAIQAIQLIKKYGLFSHRYYEEFGATPTPSRRQPMFVFAF